MGQFLPGQSGNPAGRPKGSVGGRMRALMALDRILAKHKNRRALEKALENEFLRDPVRFFKSVIMPLLPKESKLAVEPNVVVQWRSFLDAPEDAEAVDVREIEAEG